MLANKSTCTGTDCCTYSSTYSSITCNLSHDSTKSRTTGSTNIRPFGKIVTARHHDSCAERKDKSFHTFHNYLSVMMLNKILSNLLQRYKKSIKVNHLSTFFCNFASKLKIYKQNHGKRTERNDQKS